MAKRNYLNVRTSSELPSPAKVREDRDAGVLWKVEVVVYCLALYKDFNLKRAPILLVTDFSRNTNTAYFQKKLGTNLPTLFSICPNGKLLSPSQVFSISVNRDFHQLSQHLKQYSAALGKCDFSDAQNCQFSEEGVVAKLTFAVNEYQGAIEGYLYDFLFLDHSTVTDFHNRYADIEELTINMAKYSNKATIERFATQWPVHRYVSPIELQPYFSKQGNQTASKTPSIVQESEFRPKQSPQSNLRVLQVISTQNEQEPPSKVQRLASGRALAFHQFEPDDESQAPVPIDTQAPIGTQPSQMLLYLDETQDSTEGSTDEVAVKANQYATQPSQYPQDDSHDNLLDNGEPQSQYLHGTYETQQPDSQLVMQQGTQPATQPATQPPLFDDQFLVIRSTVARLRTMVPKDVHSINKKHTFEVYGTIDSIFPGPHITVKPHRRTLKVGSFKIFISDKSCKQDIYDEQYASEANRLVVEFHTEEDVCRFLGVYEVEELHENVSAMQGDIQKLLRPRERAIQIQRAVVHLDSGLLRPYWRCMSQMADLLGPDADEL